LRRVWLVCTAIFCVATPAAAQTEPPGFSVAVGAGIAFPFHSDLNFDTFDRQASVRTRVTPRFLVEGMLDQWRHTTITRRADVPLFGQSGVIGHVDEVTTDTLDTITVVGLNLLGTGAIGRVRISGGGGPGLLVNYARYTVSLSGCTATVPSRCDGSSNEEWFVTFGVQALADVDVALTSHVSAVGRVLLALPVKDAGYGHLNATAGVRMSFE
jgi:hypothetical protein